MSIEDRLAEATRLAKRAQIASAVAIVLAIVALVF